jgi:hypothetical protein
MGRIPWERQTPDKTRVDLNCPAFKCNCPSRKFSCKHGLGLYLLEMAEPALLISGPSRNGQGRHLDARTAVLAARPGVRGSRLGTLARTRSVGFHCRTHGRRQASPLAYRLRGAGGLLFQSDLRNADRPVANGRATASPGPGQMRGRALYEKLEYAKGGLAAPAP